MKQTSRRTAPRRTRTGRAGIAGRLGIAAASAGLLFGLSACGFDAQTLQPYTPSDGVNVDVGLDQNDKPTAETVKVRNLMVLAKSDGSGFLSATLTSGVPDALTAVSGTALAPDGTGGSELTAAVSAPIDIPAGTAVVLTDQTAITLSSPDLKAGQLASLTLTFERAGSRQVQVPVLDGNNDIYRTVEPTPAATPGQV